MIEVDTNAGDSTRPDRIRVTEAAMLALQTPFREALGRRDPDFVDMPALAMATVAAPTAIAFVGRGFEGLVHGGLIPAVAFGIAGAIVTALLSCIAVASLWLAEAVLARVGDGRLPGALPRAYSYALAFLATTGLPNNGLAALCLVALAAATLVGGARRTGTGSTPGAMMQGMLPPAIGYLAFHLAMTAFFALRLQAGVLGLVSGAFSGLLGGS